MHGSLIGIHAQPSLLCKSCTSLSLLLLLVSLPVSLEFLVGFSLGDPTIFLEERDLIRVIAWKAKRSWRF